MSVLKIGAKKIKPRLVLGEDYLTGNYVIANMGTANIKTDLTILFTMTARKNHKTLEEMLAALSSAAKYLEKAYSLDTVEVIYDKRGGG